MHCRLPALHGVPRTNIRILWRVQVRALHPCPGVTAWTLSAGQWMGQEVLCLELHNARKRFFEFTSAAKRGTSATIFRSSFLENRQWATLFTWEMLEKNSHALWTTSFLFLTYVCSQDFFRFYILGTKNSSLDCIAQAHQARIYIYTDGSTTASISILIFWVSLLEYSLQARAGHVASSISIEHAAIWQPAVYILTQPPAAWSICIDPKVALQYFALPTGNTRCLQLVVQSLEVHQWLLAIGREIRLQWFPSHCVIPGNEFVNIATHDARHHRPAIIQAFSRSEAEEYVTIPAKACLGLLWIYQRFKYDHLFRIHITFTHLRYFGPRPGFFELETLLPRHLVIMAYTQAYIYNFCQCDYPIL